MYHSIHTLFAGSARKSLTPTATAATTIGSGAAASGPAITGIGESLAVLALALVSELEASYLHADSRVRDVAISVSSRLIIEHPKLFVKADNLAAVWNIYFLLDWLSVGRESITSANGTGAASGSSHGGVRSSSEGRSLSASPAGTRIAVCEALEVLSAIYTPQQKTLTVQIVSRLLKLPDKSAREMEVVRNVLHRIFTDIAAISNSSSGGSDESSGRYSLYFTFLTVLTAHYEHYYDLLTWSIEDYSRIAYPRSAINFHLFPIPNYSTASSASTGSSTGTDSGGDTKTLHPSTGPKSTTATATGSTAMTGPMVAAFPKDVIDFYNSLTSHFRAQPPLIRYGAALCLYPMLKV